MQAQEIYIVAKGHPVNKKTADIVVARIFARAKLLDPNRTYSLKMFCGVEFWKNEVPVSEKTFVGIYVFDQAQLGNLPMEFVPGKHEYPISYRPKFNFNYS